VTARSRRYFTRLALSVIGTAESALETGQPALAFCA
jgi:hypothetical protein